MLRAMRVALTLAAVLLTLARPVACSFRENCDVQEGDCVDIASHTGSSTVLSRNPGRRLAQTPPSTGWTHRLPKLTAGDIFGAAGDFFGSSVSIDGDTMVIGSFKDDDPFVDSGSAYVFTRDTAGDLASGWTLVAKLTADDAAAGDWFGWSVSIDGDTIVIGSFKDDDPFVDSGSAYVFTRDTAGDLASGWTQRLPKKLTADDGGADDRFGSSVSIDGDTIVIGAYGDNDKGSSSGSAYVFTRDTAGDLASGWTQRLPKLTANDGGADDWFGSSVSIDGDTVVVGAQEAGSGSAYVFTRDTAGDLASNWTQVAKLTADDGAANDKFGRSVSINGDTVVVGAERDNDPVKGSDSGSAYVFTLPVPCDASSPLANGAVGDCTSSLASGSSCTPICDSGYALSGTRSCTDGTLSDTAVCNPNPCDASGAIANGAVGPGCTSTLAHGSSCTPTCNTGYTLSGQRSCSAGTLSDNAVCNPNDCTASPDNPNKNGDDGVLYCINHGTVSGTTGACVCSGCKAGYGGPSCETAGACSASTDPSKDGTDDTIYCINTGGIAGGTAGACTCTCKPGHEGNGCDTASACTASSDDQAKDGSDGVLYCSEQYGTIGGTTGDCTCTCQSGYGGSGCETAGACSASTDPSKDGTDGSIYCINTGGTAGGTAGECTCTCKPGHEGNGCDTASACTASSDSAKDGTDGTFYCINGGTISGTAGSCECTCKSGYIGSSCEIASSPSQKAKETKEKAETTRDTMLDGVTDAKLKKKAKLLADAAISGKKVKKMSAKLTAPDEDTACSDYYTKAGISSSLGACIATAASRRRSLAATTYDVSVFFSEAEVDDSTLTAAENSLKAEGVTGVETSDPIDPITELGTIDGVDSSTLETFKTEATAAAAMMPPSPPPPTSPPPPPPPNLVLDDDDHAAGLGGTLLAVLMTALLVL